MKQPDQVIEIQTTFDLGAGLHDIWTFSTSHPAKVLLFFGGLFVVIFLLFFILTKFLLWLVGSEATTNNAPQPVSRRSISQVAQPWRISAPKLRVPNLPIRRIVESVLLAVISLGLAFGCWMILWQNDDATRLHIRQLDLFPRMLIFALIAFIWLMILSTLHEALTRPPAPPVALEPGRPKPPTPKSKRPEVDHMGEALSERFGMPLIVFGLSIPIIVHLALFVQMDFAGAIFLSIGATVVAFIINNQDWVKEARRAKKRDQQAKWAEEDRQWDQYERDLKEWELQTHLAPTSIRQQSEPSDTVRRIVEDMKRGHH